MYIDWLVLSWCERRMPSLKAPGGEGLSRRRYLRGCLELGSRLNGVRNGTLAPSSYNTSSSLPTCSLGSSVPASSFIRASGAEGDNVQGEQAILNTLHEVHPLFHASCAE